MSRTAPTAWRHTTARAQSQAQSDSPKPTNRIKNGDTISPSKPLWEPSLRDIEGRKTVPVANCGSAQRRRHRIRNVVRLQCVMPRRAEPQASENARCSPELQVKRPNFNNPRQQMDVGWLRSGHVSCGDPIARSYAVGTPMERAATR